MVRRCHLPGMEQIWTSTCRWLGNESESGGFKGGKTTRPSWKMLCETILWRESTMVIYFDAGLPLTYTPGRTALFSLLHPLAHQSPDNGGLFVFISLHLQADAKRVALRRARYFITRIGNDFSFSKISYLPLIIIALTRNKFQRRGENLFSLSDLLEKIWNTR